MSELRHTYRDGNAQPTITVDIIDEDGPHRRVSEKAVTVMDISPTINLVGEETALEGDDYRLTLGEITDQGDDTVDSYIVDWGDTTSDTYATGGTVSHIYAENDIHTIRVSITNEDGSHLAATQPVTVNNANPTLTFSTSTWNLVANEGTLLEIPTIASVTDPGFSLDNSVDAQSAETFKFKIDWGDGTTEDEGDVTVTQTGSRGTPTKGSFGGSHTYADNGTYTVVVTVTDDDNGQDSDNFTVTVNNTAPTLLVEDAPEPVGYWPLNNPPTGSVTITDVQTSATITGDHTLTEGQTLAATATSLHDEDGLGTVTYLWKRSGNPTPIATGSTYTLVQADVGTKITVTAHYIDLQNTAENVTWVATETVQNQNDEPIGTVNLTVNPEDHLIISAGSDFTATEQRTFDLTTTGLAIDGATDTVNMETADTTVTISTDSTDADIYVRTGTTGVTITGGNDTHSLVMNGTLSQFNNLFAGNDGATLTYTIYTTTLPASDKLEVTATDSVGATWTDTAAITVIAATDPSLLSILVLNSGANLSSGTLTLTDNQYADIPADTMGDWGTESFEVSVKIKSADGTGNVTSEGTGGGALFIRSSQAGSPYTGPTAFLNNNGSIKFRMRGDEPTGYAVAELPAGISWADWIDLRFVYDAPANKVQIYVNGVEKSHTFGYAANSSHIINAPLRFGANHVNTTVQNLNAQIKHLQISGFGLAPTTGTSSVWKTLVEGQTLTASHSLADEDGLGPVTYQWQHHGESNVIGTGNTYTLAQTDVGKKITVTAIYEDLQNTSETVTSVATETVQNKNNAPVLRIRGDSTQNNTLVAELVDQDGTTANEVSYQWAYRNDTGTVSGWGGGITGAPTASGYKTVVGTESAFVATKDDNNTFAWGHSSPTGNDTIDNSYSQLAETEQAFAVLNGDGTIIASGDSNYGGNNGPTDSGYTQIAATNSAFAALKADGSITAWGNPFGGGSGAPTDDGYTAIVASHYAFAAWKPNGTISAWGHKDYGGSESPTDGSYVKIVATDSAFAALKTDGSITAWGYDRHGGSEAPTDTVYTEIVANDRAFAALKGGGKRRWHDHCLGCRWLWRRQ